ncbi:hypothetical protein [Thermosediminibacter litoriperuensis]|uniref:CAAX prenyl protease-like protein n=1 Tax=Thermosediminibacter litoriperuensis TaxID=291989 RepID=A0A5S5ACS4_9FIRM|nr:hypothetical protein [Thermosediminibacter litoriperuensis]TYP47428.1 hypothetical protein LZ11_02448 [Thermosediminibacter litoriperuensis]
MNKSELSIEQKKADIDLNIIISITLIALIIYMFFDSQIISFSKNTKVPLLLRTLFIAFFQWGVAGLGITVVTLYRKEGFIRFGLTKTNLFKTILFSILTLIPYIIFGIATSLFTSYLPFQKVTIAKEWFEIGFPYKIIGISIVAIVWGFFEGLNYVVISDRINKRYPSKNMWINWGAISCGIVCLLIHGIVGVSFYTLMEGLAVFIIIYGMLIVKNYTNNAWGCILIFTFFWNAL